MVARVVQVLRKHVVARVRNVLRPAELRTDRPALQDRLAGTVVGSAIEILDRLQLRAREAAVYIDIVRAHLGCEIPFGLEPTSERRIDYSVLDAVARVALREHGLIQNLELAQAFVLAVAVRVER